MKLNTIAKTLISSGALAAAMSGAATSQMGISVEDFLGRIDREITARPTRP